MNAALNVVAERLKIHPRTVLRALTGDKNVYWTEDHNPSVDLVALALGFDCDYEVLERIVKNRNTVFTQEELAKHFDITTRSVRLRNYPPFISWGHVVRYHLPTAAEHHLTLKRLHERE